MNTSPRFKGNPLEMGSSPTFDAKVQQRMTLVEWINSAVPQFYLSVKVSDEELRASLIDGDIFSKILQRFKYISSDEVDDSIPSPESRRWKIKRFIAAMSELGLPCFEITDLEKGSMRPVVDCLLALKDHTKKTFGSPRDDRTRGLSEIKFQRQYSLLSPESPTMLLHGGNKFHEVFQMKQGLYADLPATKISEMIKSNSLDNAPTQSLLSVVNGILDESIERKNSEIPQRVACLLRKVVQEIERRIATQGEHLRTQSNLFKAREDKYHSRIKVLEALAKGTSEESEIVMNQLQQLKLEKSQNEEKQRREEQDMEEKKRLAQTETEDKKSSEQQKKDENKTSEQRKKDEHKTSVPREMEEKRRVELTTEEKKKLEQLMDEKLKKLREETNIEISMLKNELEMEKKKFEQKMAEKNSFEQPGTEEKKKTVQEEAETLKKLREETNIEISMLKNELEMEKKRFKQKMTEKHSFEQPGTEEKKKTEQEEAEKLKKLREETNIEISMLKNELEMEKKRFEQKMAEKNSFSQQETEEKKKLEEMMEEKKKFEQEEAEKLKKLTEEKNKEILMLKNELEMEKKNFEQKMEEKKRFDQQATEEEEKKRVEQIMEEKKRFEEMMEEKKRFEQQEAEKLKKLREETNTEISMLKKELEVAKRTHEVRFRELETEGKELEAELENKLREQDQLLEDSKVKMKELELNSESKSRRWKKKEDIYEKFMDLQLSGLEDLRRSSVSIKQGMLETQKTYMKELNSVGAKLKNLAKAAQSYHEVLNENRKLYNELQDLKGNIRVFCRVRPFQPGENKKQTIVDECGQHGELIVSNPARPGDAQKTFKFNKVYGPMATQAAVFADTQPLIRTILDGYNVCIFAYGQTGSGKTYTMSGPDNASKEDWGVNYRALDDLFQVSEDRKHFCIYEIGVQMIEIYNEQIRDLLSSDPGSQKKLGILTTPQSHGLAVPDASMHPVASTKDVIELMNIGLANRSVSATAMNQRSSRSHSVVTIHVQGKELKSGARTHGSLHLVDLAGSERIDRSEVSGDRLKEAQHINKSLSALGDVIFALAQKSPHVPYRNSKLTQVLQSSLGGRAKTLMFVQVNPDVTSFTESLSTLKFAERVSGVELGAARNNKDGKDVKELMDQVASLKEAMLQKDEELERLQKDPKSLNIPSKRSTTSSLKTVSSGPSSPRPTASSPRKSPTRATGVRRPGVNKSFDSSSDINDEYESEGIRSSRSMTDLKGQKKSPSRPSKLSTGGTSSIDDEITGVDDDDDRLSETSDGDNPVEEERREPQKTPTRLPQSPRATPTGASRLSQVKTTLRATSALKKPVASGSSSPVAPPRRRP